jgi:hypothetical protein
MVMHDCCTGAEWERDILLHIAVCVRPAFRPSRWAWYVVDCESGEIMEHAFEYESPLAARRAGLDRLRELASCFGEIAGGAVGLTFKEF